MAEKDGVWVNMEGATPGETMDYVVRLLRQLGLSDTQVASVGMLVDMHGGAVAQEAREHLAKTSMLRAQEAIEAAAAVCVAAMTDCQGKIRPNQGRLLPDAFVANLRHEIEQQIIAAQAGALRGEGNDAAGDQQQEENAHE